MFILFEAQYYLFCLILLLLCKCSMFSQNKTKITELQIVALQDSLVQTWTLVECFKEKTKTKKLWLGYSCCGFRTWSLFFNITLLAAFWCLVPAVQTGSFFVMRSFHREMSLPSSPIFSLKGIYGLEISISLSHLNNLFSYYPVGLLDRQRAQKWHICARPIFLEKQLKIKESRAHQFL